MQFRLATVLYVFALAASAMGVFGFGWGILAFASVVIFHAGWPSILKNKVAPLGCLSIFVVVAILALLLMPTVHRARESSRLGSSLNRISQFMKALIHYDSVHNQLPPAITYDADGRPLHSWRTLILPSLDQQALFDMIDVAAAWDSGNNQAVFSSIADGPEIFINPRIGISIGPHKTTYLAVVGPECVLQSSGATSLNQIRDAPSKTIVLIETLGHEVDWYEPRDLSLEEAIDVLCGEFSDSYEWTHRGYFLSTRYCDDRLVPRAVAFADGHVESFGVVRDRKIARALLTRDGGEDLSNFDNYVDWGAGAGRVPIGYIIHWGHIWGAGLFVAIAVAPFFKRGWFFPAQETDEAPEAVAAGRASD